MAWTKNSLLEFTDLYYNTRENCQISAPNVTVQLQAISTLIFMLKSYQNTTLTNRSHVKKCQVSKSLHLMMSVYKKKIKIKVSTNKEAVVLNLDWFLCVDM